MKMNYAKSRLFFVLVLAGLLTGQIFPQSSSDQRRIEGKAAYEDGDKYLAERNRRSYLLALEKFELSASIFRALSDKEDTYQLARALLGVGLLKDFLDDNESAIETYKEALGIFRALGDKKISEGIALNRLGMLYEKTGDRAMALEMQNQALPVQKGSGNKFGEAYTLNNIGTIYRAMGENVKALEFYERSLAIQIELDEKHYQASTLNGIGQVYSTLRNTKKALDAYERSLALLRVVGDKEAQAVLLNNIGTVKSNAGDDREAISFHQQAIVIFTELGFENRKATVLGNIGSIYLRLNDPQKALEYHQQSLPLYRAMGEKEGEAIALLKIGYTQSELGDTDSALSNLNSGLLLARLVQSREREAEALAILMGVYKKRNNLPVAIIMGKQSVETYQELRRSVKDLVSSEQNLFLKSFDHNYRRLADLLIEMGRFGEAEEILQMLKDEEYSAFVRRDADEMTRLNRKVRLNAKERQLIAKYSLLSSRVVELGEQFRKLDDRKRVLSRSTQSLSIDEEKQYQLLTAQVAYANAAFRLFIEKELINELGTENAKSVERDRGLQDKLRIWGNGTVALYTVLTENRYRVILTTPTVQIDGKTEINAAVLNKKIFAFRKAVQDPNADPLPLGKEIYDILIKPIEKQLLAAGAKTLIWSLDSTLRYVPLGALSPDGKTYLAAKYQNAVITPKTRDSLADTKLEWKALGMGVSEEQTFTDPDNPTQKQKVSALPGTKAELTAIVRDDNNPNEKGILSGRRFLDKEFTFKNFADSLSEETTKGRRKFTVIHLASHFHLGSNWENSYLILGDGSLLTLEKLINSPEITFGDAELVTLSACNTASAADFNGKEIDSLAGAIQSKSGKAVLATLWEVYDESTAQLMTHFYRIRNENPKTTKASALQQAQKILISNSEFSHPYYWSGFVLIGNWR